MSEVALDATAARDAFAAVSSSVPSLTTSPKLDELRRFLTANGFLRDDPRFNDVFSMADAAPASPESPPISPSLGSGAPKRSISQAHSVPLAADVVGRAFAGTLAIPDFQHFANGVKSIFEDIAKQPTVGSVASYIPQLASVDPGLFAVSFCSVDGQRFNLGDSNVDFSIQSCCKPVSYSIALEELGATKVHKHIGREPSGKAFNHMSLLDQKGSRVPHNPMINAGAIMSSSLIQMGNPLYKRFSKVSKVWTQLFGGKRISFNNSIYLSEKETADRNYALAYNMKEAGAFPEGTDITETLEFYFQCCSLEADTNRMAIMAATYANGGVCPLTGETVFEANTVRNCLSLMASCGMYDYSGEWNFSIGLPAKSGVSGALWVVVPDVGGFCCYSPCIDSIGNSRRAVEFFKALSATYAFHLLEPARLRGLKHDPTMTPAVKSGVMKGVVDTQRALSGRIHSSSSSGSSSTSGGEDTLVAAIPSLVIANPVQLRKEPNSASSDGLMPERMFPSPAKSPIRHASDASLLSRASSQARHSIGGVAMAERAKSKDRFRQSVIGFFNRREDEDRASR
ncbi:glutaminase-domain-containing protein [Chytriomyces sp. MP71]|nr:glutaminase-domain-containing protein [Chytriomyces sp. MP71]